MRVSDQRTGGECEKHGPWEVAVTWLCEGEIVPDECPMCEPVDQEKLREETYSDGYKDGLHDRSENTNECIQHGPWKISDECPTCEERKTDIKIKGAHLAGWRDAKGFEVL